MKASRVILISGWILFTLSLSVWWLIYGLEQIEKNSSLNSAEISKGEHMLRWEGGFLIFMLILGGLALLYYSLSDYRQNQKVKEFYATLTHELKTPLASLRLQVESLQEDLEKTEHAKLIHRLVGDAFRLEIQLENALFLASYSDSESLHIESLNLSEMADALRQSFPEIDLSVSDNLLVRGDRRALEGVFRNLVQNAKHHGHATKVTMNAKPDGSNIVIEVEDNGRGFEGDTKTLGKLFARHTSQSGSGVGLYLAKTLTEKMKGKIIFVSRPGAGFKAQLTLPVGRMS